MLLGLSIVNKLFYILDDQPALLVGWGASKVMFDQSNTFLEVH